MTNKLNFFRIQLIVDSLGLSSYHGFTSSLIRTCVEKLRAGAIEPNCEFSAGFVTALFSLIYHIAGFDYGNLQTYLFYIFRRRIVNFTC